MASLYPARVGWDRDDDILPDEPEDLHTSDDYEYELTTIMIDIDGAVLSRAAAVVLNFW